MPDELHLRGEYRVGESHIPMYDDGEFVGYVILSFAQVIDSKEYAAAAMFHKGDLERG
jgi:hypothetical protein